MRCSACRRVLAEDEIRPSCPHCGSTGEAEPWPSPLIQRLFNATDELFQSGDEELTVILACELLEALFEMLFRDLFWRQRRPASWVEWILRKNKSLDLRIRYLFKEMFNVSLRSALRGTPFQGFDRRWAMMRSTRGLLLQPDLPAMDGSMAREAYALSRDGLALFAWLNNRYCVV
jgi:hypothetical protein